MGWLTGWNYRKSHAITESIAPVGTITVVNGSAAIVGVGTNFLSWAVGDKIQLPDANWYTIATITDGTHLTISIVYPGAGVGGQVYKMQRINYQVKITVHYEAGSDSGENVYCNGKCQTDFDDIRFTDSGGSTELKYWMESKTDSDNAIFWVKVPIIQSDTGASLYLYYGNAAVSTTSNGIDTFPFFDDFNDNSLDPKWNYATDNATYAKITEQNQRLEMWTGGSSGVAVWARCWASAISIPRNAAVRMRAYWIWSGTNENADHAVGMSDKSDKAHDSSNNIFDHREAIWNGIPAGYKHATFSRKADVESYATFPDTGYLSNYVIEDITWTAALVKDYINGVLKNTITTNIPEIALYAHFSCKKGSGAITWLAYFDWYAIRKYVDTEPANSTWGNAETSLNLKAGFRIRRSNSQILKTKFYIVNSTSQNLKTEFNIRSSTSQNLKAGFSSGQGFFALKGKLITRHTSSGSLKAGFDSQAINLLKGKYVIRKTASLNLKAGFTGQVNLNLNGKFIARHSTTLDLFNKFIIRHTTIESLKGGFDSQAIELLLGKFTARHSDTGNEKARFVVRQSGFLDIPRGIFNIMHWKDLKAGFIARHTGFRNLQGHFYVQHWEDLKSRFIVRHSVFYDYRMNLRCGFLVPQHSRGLKNKLRIRHSAMDSLKAGFFIGYHSTQNLKAGFNVAWTPQSTNLKAGFRIAGIIVPFCEIIIREDDFLNWINYFEYSGTGFLARPHVFNDAVIKATGVDSFKIDVGAQSKGYKEITFGWNWTPEVAIVGLNEFSLREHEKYGGYDPEIEFSHVFGPSILSMAAGLGLNHYGCGYVFMVCDRHWLQHKYIRWTWSCQTGFPTWPSKAEIWDGAYDRGSDTDFPPGVPGVFPGSDKIVKGAGLLQTLSSRTGWFPDTTEEVQVDVSAGSMPYVTIFFWFDDRWWSDTGVMKLLWFEINSLSGGVGNLLRDDFSGAIIMERSGTWNDYGYIERDS